MPKALKLALAVFIGLDVFVFGYLLMAQLRLVVFGQGQIPGGGSAIDMALFLGPLLVGYIAGDRLYHFLNYKERRAAKTAQTNAHAKTVTTETPDRSSKQEQPVPTWVAQSSNGSVWDDEGWADSKDKETR